MTLYCLFFIHPSADGRPGWFHFLASANRVAISMAVPVSQHGCASVPVVCYPGVLRGDLQEWQGWVLCCILVLLSLRMLCIDFHSGSAGLYSQEQWRVLLSPHPPHILQSFVSLIAAIQTRVRLSQSSFNLHFSGSKGYGIHFFDCLLATCVSSYEKRLFSSLVCGLVGSFSL